MKENDVNTTKKGKLSKWLADAAGFIGGAGSVLFGGWAVGNTSDGVISIAVETGMTTGTAASASVGNE